MLNAKLVEVFLRVEFSKQQYLPNALRVSDSARVDQNGVMTFLANSVIKHPSYHSQNQTIIKINNLGYRGDDPDPSIKNKIAIVGDSVVFNGGVEEQDTFQKLAQAKLNSSAGEKFEILNFGMSSTNLREYALRIEHKIIAINPKAIVVGLYLNDLIDPPMNADFKAAAKTNQTLLKRVLAKSLLLQNLYRGFYNLWITYLSPSSSEFAWIDSFNKHQYITSEEQWHQLLNLASKDWGSAWDKKNWTNAKQTLNQIKTLTDQNNIDLYVVIFPVSPQVYIKEPYLDLFLPQQYASELLSELNVKFLDLLPALRANSGLRLFNDQCHLTKEANIVVADQLANFMQLNLL